MVFLSLDYEGSPDRSPQSGVLCLDPAALLKLSNLIFKALLHLARLDLSLPPFPPARKDQCASVTQVMLLGLVMFNNTNTWHLYSAHSHLLQVTGH